MKKTFDELIEMAEQQILGYCECANGSSLTDLVCSMGLIKEEWDEMRNRDDLTYMTEDQKEEVDSCFEEDEEEEETETYREQVQRDFNEGITK